jgi:hypothetical protein
VPGINVKIYECQVTAVRIEDRVFDAKSRNGTPFKNVSYLLPYANLLGGGFDATPRSGDSCIIAADSASSSPTWIGRWAICLGFRLPVTPNAGGLELGGRITDLPSGSVVMRAIDEEGNDARVVCFSGGTVLLGSGDACQTVYSPVDKSIIHVFNQWEMHGPAGYVRWLRETGSSDPWYRAQYRTRTNEDEDALRVDIDIGGSEDNPVRIDVTRLADQEVPNLTIRVDSFGEVFIEGESININGKSSVDITGGTVSILGREVLKQTDPI